MSILDQYKREIEELQMFLSEIGNQLEQVSGFVQRKSELTGSGLVKILVLGSLAHGKMSLRGFCRVAEDLGIVISESGLHQRLNERAVELLRQVTHLWLSQQSTGEMKAVLGAFAQVHIMDSSLIRLPDGLAAAFRGTRYAASMKVQLGYEYKQGKIEALEIEAGCQTDQKSGVIEAVSHAGDLVLFDLGYFDQKRFARLAQNGVFFVSRLHAQAGLYLSQDSPQAVDLLKVIAKKSHQGELTYYLGSQERVPVRLIYDRLPANVIAERRRKAHEAARQRGQSCSKQTLARLEWLFFVTNVPDTLLNRQQVGEVYRLRWQIELIFKVWKSEMDLDAIGHWRVERVLAQVYGRILALLLFHGLLEKYSPLEGQEWSMTQAYQILRASAARLIGIVRRNFWGIKTFLSDFGADLRRFAVKTKRRKNLSTLDRLRAVRA